MVGFGGGGAVQVIGGIGSNTVAFKAAVGNAVAHGILQLGAETQLVCFAAVVLIHTGVCGKLATALVILDGDQVAPVVELQNLGDIVMVGKGCLVMGVGEGQASAGLRAVPIRYAGHTAAALDGGFIGILQPVAVDIRSGGQQMARITVGTGLPVFIRYSGQVGSGIAEGDTGDLRIAAAGITDPDQKIVRVVVEEVLSPGTVGNLADPLGTSIITDINAADNSLVIFLPDQTAAAVEHGGVAVLIQDGITGDGTAGLGYFQGKLHSVLVPVFLLFTVVAEVVPGTVAVLPDVEGLVSNGLGADPLVEVGAPAVAKAEVVFVGFVAVVHVADGNRHPVAAEANVSTGPDQVAGVVVHMAGTRSAGRSGAVVIVAFQTQVAAVVYIQHGRIYAAVGFELGAGVGIVIQCRFIRRCQRDGGIVIFVIPFLCRVGQIPVGICRGSGCNIIVQGNIGIVSGLIVPGKAQEPAPVIRSGGWGVRHVISGHRKLWHIDVAIAVICHGKSGVDDDGIIRDLGQIMKVDKQAVTAQIVIGLVGGVAYGQGAPAHGIVIGRGFHNEGGIDILIGVTGVQLQCGVDTHRKRPVRIVDPIGIRCHRQHGAVFSGGKGIGYVGGESTVGVLHVWSGDVIDLLSVPVYQRDRSVPVQPCRQTLQRQREVIAVGGLGLPDNDLFLDIMAVGCVFQVHAGIHIGIDHSGGKSRRGHILRCPALSAVSGAGQLCFRYQLRCGRTVIARFPTGHTAGAAAQQTHGNGYIFIGSGENMSGGKTRGIHRGGFTVAGYIAVSCRGRGGTVVDLLPGIVIIHIVYGKTVADCHKAAVTETEVFACFGSLGNVFSNDCHRNGNCFCRGCAAFAFTNRDRENLRREHLYGKDQR